MNGPSNFFKSFPPFILFNFDPPPLIGSFASSSLALPIVLKSSSRPSINCLNVLGKDKVTELLHKCNFNQPIELDTELHQQHQEKIQQEHQE